SRCLTHPQGLSEYHGETVWRFWNTKRCGTSPPKSSALTAMTISHRKLPAWTTEKAQQLPAIREILLVMVTQKGHSNWFFSILPETKSINLELKRSGLDPPDVENTVFDLGVMEPLCFGLLDQRCLIALSRSSLVFID
ncbi:hypothetical protein Tco_0257092, partial [Tanacetum coccineum]